MINTTETAKTMFARWARENYFKYLIENYDFDKMIRYEILNQTQYPNTNLTLLYPLMSRVPYFRIWVYSMFAFG